MTLPNFKHNDIPAQSTSPEVTSTVESFDEPVRRVPKFVKWLGGTALGLVILAGAGGIIATQVVDQQKYKELAITKVQEATGYTIDWEGNISIGLMPLPHASVQQLSVKAGKTDVLTIKNVDVQISLSSLLSKKIDIRNVSIDEPKIQLVTSKNGNQEWIAKPKDVSVKNEETSSEGGKAASSDFDVVVKNISINDGLLLVDNQKSKSKQEFKDINLSLRADSLKGPFDMDGDMNWSGQPIRLKVTSGEIAQDEGNYPLQATITLPKAGTELAFTGVVDSQKMGASGDLSLDIDDLASAVKGMTGTAPSLPEGLGGKTNLAGKMLYSANRISLDDLSFAIGSVGFKGQVSADGLSEGSTPQFSFDLTPRSKVEVTASTPPLVALLYDLKIAARASVENNKLQIATATIKTRGNDFSVNGFTTLGETPTVDLSIQAKDINLDGLNGSSNGAATAAATSKDDSSGSAVPQGFALPFSGHIRADISTLKAGGKTYSNIKTDVTSKGKVLTISEASLRLPQDTNVRFSGKIADTSTLSGLDLNLVANTMDAEALSKSFGITLPELPKHVGVANVKGHFTGDLNMLGFDATVSALQFSVTGKGKVGTPLATPEISSLNFTVRHPNFNEAMQTFQSGFEGSNGFYGPMDVSGQLAWGGDKIEVSSLSGKLGQTSVAGELAVVTKPKSKVTGNLSLGAIVLPSATNSSGSVSASAKTPAVSPSGGSRWSRAPIDTAWMHSFDADIAVKAKSITQNLWRLTDANLAFQLNDGVLRLNDVSAGLFGGKASINGTIKSGAGANDPLTIDAKLNAENVDAQGLMSAATGKTSYTLTGTLSSVDTAIQATGTSPYALVQTLSGDGTMRGKNLVVKGVDAAQLAAAARGSYKPLERAGSLFQSFQGGQTEFSDFNAEFAIQNGIVNFSKILFDGSKATLSSTGNVNLPQWTLDLKNSMTVKDTDIPPFDFSVRGPLDNPINSGGDVINNYLQNKLQKKATKFIEDKFGGKLDKLLGVPAEPVAPSTSIDPQTQAQPDAATQKQNIKQEAAKEAVKALQGLLGGR